MVERVEILPAFISDHRLIIIELAQSNEKRGPGSWKFNNSFLHDKDFVQGVNDILDEELQDVPCSYKQKWEYIKVALRSFIIDYSIKKAKSKANLLEVCERRLIYLNEDNSSDVLFTDKQRQLNETVR